MSDALEISSNELSKVIEMRKEFAEGLLKYYSINNNKLWRTTISTSKSGNIPVDTMINKEASISTAFSQVEFANNELQRAAIKELQNQESLMKILASKKHCPISKIIDEI